MFVNILIILIVYPVIGTNNLTNIEDNSISISKCEFLYKKNIIDKIGIEYITLKQLKSRIRLYNYNIYKFFALQNKNKKNRRKIRRDFYRANNYKTNSNSKELEYLEDICSINYDKIDKPTLETIKFKNEKIKFLMDNELFKNTSNSKFIIFSIITFLYIIIQMIGD